MALELAEAVCDNPSLELPLLYFDAKLLTSIHKVGELKSPKSLIFYQLRWDREDLNFIPLLHSRFVRHLRSGLKMRHHFGRKEVEGAHRLPVLHRAKRHAHD